jgi:molybdopterin-guanine dinucleotide biosynthesis protein A
MSQSSRGLGPHTAIVLAGGHSKRMGGTDKAFVALAGKSLLARTIDRINPQVERVVLTANGDPSRFAKFAVPVVPDTADGVGPLAGLHAGMRWSEKNLPEARFAVSIAADMPFLPADLVERLAEGCGRDENTVALAASPAGTHPICGLWPIALADGLERLLRSRETTTILAFADRFMRLNVPFDDLALPNGETVDPFFNVNTPDDVARAERIVAILEGRQAEAIAST